MSDTNDVQSLTPRSISTTELLERLGDPGVTIVDVRPIAAYNGWRLQGEARGGHIPGAKAFPAAWLRSIDEVEIERLLHDKGITPDRTIVVYGDGAEDAAALDARLTLLGHPDILRYDAGFAAWAADERLPIERLPKYERLVHVEWLRQLLAGEGPEAYDNDKFLLFHVNFGVPEEYEEGHLPGALYLDTNRLENPADWNRRSPEEIEATVRALGITHDTTVVALRPRHGGRRQREVAGPSGRADRRDPRRAHPAATPASTTSACSTAATTGGSPTDIRSRPCCASRRRSRASASRSRSAPTTSSTSARPRRSWPTRRAPRSSASAPGASTSATSAATTTSARPAASPATSGATAAPTRTTCSTTATWTTRCAPIPEIAANWEEAGITRDKWVAFYCGTGWRAAETWFYAFLMDWPRIAVYDGGWFEWSQDPINNPIEVGEPEDGVAA